MGLGIRFGFGLGLGSGSGLGLARRLRRTVDDLVRVAGGRGRRGHAGPKATDGTIMQQVGHLVGVRARVRGRARVRLWVRARLGTRVRVGIRIRVRD